MLNSALLALILRLCLLSDPRVRAGRFFLGPPSGLLMSFFVRVWLFVAGYSGVNGKIDASIY